MSQLEAEIRRIVREELAKTVKRLSECSAIRQEAVSTDHQPHSALASSYTQPASEPVPFRAFPYPHRSGLSGTVPYPVPRRVPSDNVSPPPAAVKASRRNRSSRPPKRARHCTKKGRAA